MSSIFFTARYLSFPPENRSVEEVRSGVTFGSHQEADRHVKRDLKRNKSFMHCGAKCPTGRSGDHSATWYYGTNSLQLDEKVNWNWRVGNEEAETLRKRDDVLQEVDFIPYPVRKFDLSQEELT